MLPALNVPPGTSTRSPSSGSAITTEGTALGVPVEALSTESSGFWRQLVLATSVARIAASFALGTRGLYRIGSVEPTT